MYASDVITNIDDNLLISVQFVTPVNSKTHNQNSLDALITDILNFLDESTTTIFVETGNIPNNFKTWIVWT